MLSDGERFPDRKRFLEENMFLSLSKNGNRARKKEVHHRLRGSLSSLKHFSFRSVQYSPEDYFPHQQ